MQAFVSLSFPAFVGEQCAAIPFHLSSIQRLNIYSAVGGPPQGL